MKTIDRDELRQQLGFVTVAEVLPASYYEAGHIPGAIHLPLQGLEDRANGLDRESSIVVYCSGPTCTNSHQAAERLGRMGFRDVRVFVGGKAEWRDAGLALETLQVAS